MSNRILVGIGLLVALALIAYFRLIPGFGPSQPELSATKAPAPVAAVETPAPAPATPAPAVAPAETPANPLTPPSFDVVRVEPNGDIVVGGRAQAGASVALLSDGKVIDKAKSGESGQFAMVPPALPPGGHTLSLMMTLPDGKAVPSAQTVTVDIPEAKKGAVLVAKSEPGKATELLAPVTPAPDAELAVNKPLPTGPRAMVGITVVEADETGAFYVAGKSQAGASVRLYLNDSLVASGEATDDSSWSFKIERGVVPGKYQIRIDDADPKTGKVFSRAEVAFEMPGKPPASEAPAASASTPAASTESASQASATPSTPAQSTSTSSSASSSTSTSAKTALVVVPSIETAIVVRGDSLWRISSKTYGSGFRYTEIHRANREQIRDPDLIYPGQIFVLPKMQ